MRALAASVALAATVVLAASPLPVRADPIVEAQLAAQELAGAAERLARAQSGKDRVAALTGTIRAYESGLSAMRDGLRAATIRERTIRLAFEQRRDQLARLLGVLQTIERAPAPLLMIHPTGPVGTARSGMMMSQVTPSLQRQAEELRAQLEELSALRSLQEEAEERLRLGLAGVQEARIALSQAIASRTDLPRRVSDDPVKVQILADSATSLEVFAGSIGVLPPDAQDSRPTAFAAFEGKLRLPVEGTILRRFREADAAGLARPGLLIAARPLALVTTPVTATIRYSGAFLDYGNVAILEPEAGFLIVIAGLDQVYGEIGEIKDAGSPIGLLGGDTVGAQEFLIEASEGGGAIAQETLYIEIRHEGDPIDPLPWFALTD